MNLFASHSSSCAPLWLAPKLFYYIKIHFKYLILFLNLFFHWFMNTKTCPNSSGVGHFPDNDFPDNDFPDNDFPDNDFPDKWLSRQITFPTNDFPDNSLSRQMTFPTSNFLRQMSFWKNDSRQINIFVQIETINFKEFSPKKLIFHSIRWAGSYACAKTEFNKKRANELSNLV
jgi:hypothetical protein